MNKWWIPTKTGEPISEESSTKPMHGDGGHLRENTTSPTRSATDSFVVRDLDTGVWHIMGMLVINDYGPEYMRYDMI